MTNKKTWLSPEMGLNLKLEIMGCRKRDGAQNTRNNGNKVEKNRYIYIQYVYIYNMHILCNYIYMHIYIYYVYIYIYYVYT